MENNLPTKEELEILFKVSYKEYRKRIINIMISNKEYFNNNLKDLYDKNLHLEDNYKKRILQEKEDEIKDMKKIQRNNIYMIIFMTVVLILLLFTYAKSTGRSSTAIGFYVLFIGRSILKYNKARIEMKELVKKINNPIWFIKNELNINFKKLLDDSIDLFKKNDFINSAKVLSTILDKEKTIPEIYWLRGLVYEKNSMQIESKKDYENALLLNPKFEKNENVFIKQLLNLK
ncbi:MAG: hypothetical protein NTU73_05850 [Ignavibacteriae bacterium]|nr:hypothetical protein [Ignavibacteriota bacterium]